MRKSIKINALLNVTKQIMQVIFPIITVPYITRVLLPENYGKINFGNSIINYIMLIAGLGISSYAIREGSLIRNKRKDFNLFCNQVFSINIASTIVAYVILAFLLVFVPYFKEYRLLLIIQSMAVLFTTIGADWINTIEEDYLYLTVRYIILHIISLILMFVLVKEPEDYYLYAVIALVTSVGANALNIIYIRRYVKLRITFDIDWSRHMLPIMILFSNAIAMTIYVSSDITMLGIFKGDTEVGIYSVSTKIYSVIKQILNAIVIVAIPRLTAYIGTNRLEEYGKLGEKVLSALITLMCPLVAGIMVFRNEAVFLAGGSEYLSGATSLLILTMAIVSSLIATFFSGCVLMPLRREKYILKGTVIAALINVFLNCLFIPFMGSDGAAITTLISETYVAICFVYLAKKEDIHLFNIRVLLLSIVGCIAVTGISIVMKTYMGSFWLYIGLSVITSTIVYGAIQFIGKNHVFP